MSSHDHVLSHLTYSTRVAKRAQYEAFEFTLVPEGVLVRNASHANPADHEYRVTIRDGIPIACECPADEHYEGACKHRVSVALRTPVLQAAVDRQLAADGGPAVGTDQDGRPAVTSRGRPTECSCDDLDGFPCWHCVRTGRKDLHD
jgi:hypothetical protein